MSPTKSHDRDCFYKYFSFDGAKLALENKKFLYRAPAFFNDPFDSQVILQPGISEEEGLGIFFDVLSEAILDRRPEPRLGLTADVLARLPAHFNREGLDKIKDLLLSMLPKDYFLKNASTSC